MAHAHHYRLRTRWTGAAEGPTTTYAAYSRAYVVEIDGKPALAGSADPIFRGDPALYNPEEWLVAALSACHMLSYLALCARGGIRVIAYEDEATGTMQLQDGRIRFTEVMLHPRVSIDATSDLGKAEQLHERAHEECFIANSVNFPVRHEASVTVAITSAEAPAT
jgi:organic hydroperoxide reductase OsmC/OhrA